jgi:hypothetical protein
MNLASMIWEFGRDCGNVWFYGIEEVIVKRGNKIVIEFLLARF